MLPRERVMAAIDHCETDRVPVDLWAEEPVWERLLSDLGLKTRDALLERLEVDVRYVSPVYPPDVVANGVKQNMWGERWMMSNTPWGRDWEHVTGALGDVTSLDEIKAFRGLRATTWTTPPGRQCDKYAAMRSPMEMPTSLSGRRACVDLRTSSATPR